MADLHADEGDLNLDKGGVVVGVGLGGTDDGGDELTDPHAERTVDQKRSTTESLNGPEGDGSGADINEGSNERDQEWVGDGAQVLEEDGTEVEDAEGQSWLIPS